MNEFEICFELLHWMRGYNTAANSDRWIPLRYIDALSRLLSAGPSNSNANSLASEMYADVCRENNILKRQIEQLEQALLAKPPLIGRNINDDRHWINLETGVVIGPVPEDREAEARQWGYYPLWQIKEKLSQTQPARDE